MIEEGTPVCPTTCDKVKEIRTWRPEELKAFRDLAKWCITNWHDLYRLFTQSTRVLAKRGIEINYDWSRLQAFEQSLAQTAATGDFDKASVDMAAHLLGEIKTYMPELMESDLAARVATELSARQTRRSQQESR